MSLAKQVDEWLLKRSLGDSDLKTIFHELCQRLSGVGIPIARARLSWTTLHPLFRAEMVKWRRGEETTLEHFHHQDSNSQAWMRSPLRYMVESDLPVLRRRLSGAGKLVDFDILADLVDEGYTDYIAFFTKFSQPGLYVDMHRPGVFVIWASDRDSGFTDEDIDVLQEIQFTFALVCKAAIQTEMMKNIVETYLGRQAGRSVMEGNIRLGDGASTKSLVWFSDLRNSTGLTEKLSSDDYLSLLNVYFECAARPAIKAGGEVLAFIGDAVLVIYPLGKGDDIKAVTHSALVAIAESRRMREDANRKRLEKGLEPIDFGIALTIGHVVFGNIGVPERLAFTMIGPTVTEAERIEKLTKGMDTDVLASAEVAGFLPGRWKSVGFHALDGVEAQRELFAPLADCDLPETQVQATGVPDPSLESVLR